MIFIACLTIISILLCLKCHSLTKQTGVLKNQIQSQQESCRFFTKQIDHFLNETSRLSEECAATHNENSLLAEELRELRSQQQSKSVRLGQLTEQVIPLHVDFGIDYKCLVPMFRPIDYIAFQEDRITFIEIKMGTSQLSQKQKNIKRLIEENKVYFKEIRVSESGLEEK